jgi:hypothetical protein
MLQGPRYRPGLRRRAKPEPGPVVVTALVLVALVVIAVVSLVHKPGFVAATRSAEGVQSPAGIQSASPKPLPSATPVAVSPGNPASYLELLNANPEKLPPDQARLADVLNHAALDISKGPDDYLALAQRLDQDVLKPLNTAKTQAELEKIRTTGQRLRDEAKRASDFYAAFPTSLTGELTKAGLAVDLAGQVAAKFVEQAQSIREPVFHGADTVGQDAIACVDVLEKNKKAWRRNAGGKLTFRSKSVVAAYKKSSDQLKGDVDKLNQALLQYR